MAARSTLLNLLTFILIGLMTLMRTTTAHLIETRGVVGPVLHAGHLSFASAGAGHDTSASRWTSLIKKPTVKQASSSVELEEQQQQPQQAAGDPTTRRQELAGCAGKSSGVGPGIRTVVDRREEAGCEPASGGKPPAMALTSGDGQNSRRLEQGSNGGRASGSPSLKSSIVRSRSTTPVSGEVSSAVSAEGMPLSSSASAAAKGSSARLRSARGSSRRLLQPAEGQRETPQILLTMQDLSQVVRPLGVRTYDDDHQSEIAPVTNGASRRELQQSTNGTSITSQPPAPASQPSIGPRANEVVVWPRTGGRNASGVALTTGTSLESAMALPTVPAAPARIVVWVAIDGTGDFQSVQAAVGAAEEGWTIRVRAGIYEGQVTVKVPRVTLIGEDATSTIIRDDKSVGEVGTLQESATFTVDEAAIGFVARSITFDNDHGPNNGKGDQAIALAVYADMASFYDCQMLGWQDTLYAQEGRQYYKDCLIEGSVDFVFGGAVALFEKCTYFLKARPGVKVGYIAAHSRDSASGRGGFVLVGGLVDCDAGMEGFLGRTWGSHARTVYAGTYMEDCIDPKGWTEMPGFAKEGRSFVEAACEGPGANRQGRASFSVEMTATEVLEYRGENFLRPL
ncbi:hypothetical protein CBR_g22273 [Chara braunii]|uniref:Pectinesterase n=1 Tax=Chara braunii TaxID=69332 RepID=A0A388L2J0_CHABU|nr:hypothetical protein CBR_g22273 [Chara braunii]|eukprot:GBG76525.1 hypothetical protein CBR_g22273 [Chara braunii]